MMPTAPSPYVIQADATHLNAANLPTTLIAVMGYVTGIDGVQWTQEDWDRFPFAGKIRLDQTSLLEVFGIVNPDGSTDADGADIEPSAGTMEAFIPQAQNRANHGHHSMAYMSWGADGAELAAARLMVARYRVPGVVYFVAEYSWSMQESIAFLEANPDCVGVQFATPRYNPNTNLPGSGLTLLEAGADLSVKRASWFGSSASAATAWVEP